MAYLGMAAMLNGPMFAVDVRSPEVGDGGGPVLGFFGENSCFCLIRLAPRLPTMRAMWMADVALGQHVLSNSPGASCMGKGAGQ